METSGLQTLLPLSEETEEPWPKKIKIDKSRMSEGKHQVLQNLYHADKKSAKISLSFPEVLWNFSQNGLELQEEKNADLNNVRLLGHFKQCMNANLQSRLLENIPLYEELTFGGNNCCSIRDANSEFNENTLVTKSDSQGLHTKERSKSINSDIILKRNELPTVNTIFYNTMIEKLIKTIYKNVPLFKNVPEFHSNENGKDCHHEHDMFRSEEQYHIPESVTDGENINGKTSHLCLLASCLVKKRKSEFGYENKNVNEDGDFLMYKMYTQFPANNYPRTNEASHHMHMPFSRICGIRDPKLVKRAIFKLFLQDQIHNSSIPSKMNESSVFNQGHLFNIQRRGVSKESRTKESLIFSKNTLEDYTVTVSESEKEQMSKQFVFSSNQISPKNNILNSTLWEKQLCNPKKLQDLRGHFQLLNYLSSSKNIFEKLNKCSSPQTLVTVETCLQEKKIKTSSENIAFPIKKQQTSHILRSSRKHNRTFRNNINLASKSRYVHKFSRTYGRAAVNKNKYDNCKVFQENSCAFIDTEAHFSSLDQYRKIYLNTELEEVYLNSFLKKAKLNDKNNEKCNKGYTVADTRITFNVLDTLIKNCVPPLLITDVPNSNSFLMQEKKKKQYLQYININSQWSKYEINNASFPNKCFSDDDQYFTSTISHCLYKYQNLAVGVKEWHSKIALHENRDKQYGFKFGNIKGVLQSQPICRSRDSKRLKHPKIKKVDENILLQKYVLPRSLYSSELESTKQNGGDLNKIENEGIDQSYSHKSYQNQIVPYSKGESAQSTESEDNVMVESHTLKEHFEHTIEEHFPTKLKDSYEFEMKSQFDTVLEELSMFNEIDKKTETRLTCGEINILQDPLEQNCPDSILGEDARNICENMIFSTCTTALNFTMTVTQKENKESLFKDTVVQQTGKPVKQPGNRHDSNSSSISDEALFCSPSEEHCDSGCKQLSPWKPAFVCHTLTKKEMYSFQNEKRNYLCDGIRVQPLKTCRGPLRIGLSRKAKLKQLHPYLK